MAQLRSTIEGFKDGTMFASHEQKEACVKSKADEVDTKLDGNGKESGERNEAHGK